MTDAQTGYGSTYEIFYNGIWTELVEVFDIVPGEETPTQRDATHMKSPGGRRESIAGLTDVGQGSVSMNWKAQSPTDDMLRALRTSKVKLPHRITLPDGNRVTYTASIGSYSRALPLDDRLTAVAGFYVSGDEVWDTV